MVVLLKHSMDLYSTADTTKGIFTSRNMLLTLVWLLSQAIHVLVTLPLEVALVRIQASLLSEDEEPIVPFDRSFGNNGPNGLRPDGDAKAAEDICQDVGCTSGCYCSLLVSYWQQGLASALGSYLGLGLQRRALDVGYVRDGLASHLIHVYN